MQKRSDILKRARERDREREWEREKIHCSNREENEQDQRDSIGRSRVAIRLSSTTTITEADEGQAKSEDNKPDSGNDKEGSGGETNRLHQKIVIHMNNDSKFLKNNLLD